MKKLLSMLVMTLGLSSLALIFFLPRETTAQGAPGTCWYSQAFCCDTGGNIYCLVCDPCGGDDEK